jgi:putative transposase
MSRRKNMAQSLSNVLLHIVFSMKNRREWIDIEIEDSLRKYIAGICRELNCRSHQIGASDDHIHIACSLARTITISNLVEEIKTGSSKWMKTNGDRYAEFGWQNGYGAFSIGQSQLEDLRRYIHNQREHHRKVSYQREFRELLKRYGVDFDERYVWD